MRCAREKPRWKNGLRASVFNAVCGIVPPLFYKEDGLPVGRPFLFAIILPRPFVATFSARKFAATRSVF